MMMAMTAGKMEKIAQIISFTASGLVIVMTAWLVMGSVVEENPANPRNKATNEPEIAVPNFCAMVPDEKMRPVEEVPFFSVA